MNDLLELQKYQIQALQKENAEMKAKLSDATALLRELIDNIEVIKEEIL